MEKEIEHKGSLPHGYVVRTSKRYPNQVYYFNVITGNSAWDCPTLDPPRNNVEYSSSIIDNNTGPLELSDSTEKLNCNALAKKLRPTSLEEKFNSLENSTSAKINFLSDNSSPLPSDIASSQPVKTVSYNKVIVTSKSNVGASSQNSDFKSVKDLSKNSSFFIVVDTNIFVYNLKHINVIENHDMDNFGPPHIFIPWLAIEELDGMKRNKRIKSSTTRAIKFLNKRVTEKHPRYHFQTLKDIKDWSQECNLSHDDRILECCISLTDEMPPDKIVLLSNNIDLINKSRICEISAYNIKSFLRRFSVSKALIPGRIITPVKNKSKCLLSPQIKNVNPEVARKELVQSAPETDIEVEICNIMHEACMSLKEVLFAFIPMMLDEAVGSRWRNLESDVSSLSVLLHLFTKYWNSVFSQHFTEQCLKNFQYLETKLNTSRFSYITDESVTVLTIIEDIFSEINNKNLNINVPIKTIHAYYLKCMTLSAANEYKVIENKLATSDSDIVLEVFNYIWNVINYLCGVVMDFYGVKHDFPYDKPTVIPSESELDRLMSSLLPNVLNLKTLMSRAVETSNIITPPGEKFFRKFFKALVNFVPRLQVEVQEFDMSQFDAGKLKNFFYKSENQEKIFVGYKQLTHFFDKLEETVDAMLRPASKINLDAK